MAQGLVAPTAPKKWRGIAGAALGGLDYNPMQYAATWLGSCQRSSLANELNYERRQKAPCPVVTPY
jgi:hypothetical protein